MEARDIILHHYPQSPVAEKIRVVLGMKNLAWQSVIIPRLPPKPDLTELTGGYRLTPVLQIGADIFCDSPCIIRALERFYPTPGFIPGTGPGLVWDLGCWTDGMFFKTAIAVVLGDAGHNMPEDFAKDRIPLYFGNHTTVDDLISDLPDNKLQLTAQLNWIETQLATGQPFLNGDAPELPGIIDDLCYYPVWFIRGRLSDAADFLKPFPNIIAWEARIQAIGHGRMHDFDSQSALDAAKKTAPITFSSDFEALERSGLKIGQPMSVTSNQNNTVIVRGQLAHLDQETFSIERTSTRCGQLSVHFPVLGYRTLS